MKKRSPAVSVFPHLKAARRPAALLLTMLLVCLFASPAALAAVPEFSGTITNGRLCITVSGISARSYPQVLVFAQNTRDGKDSFLDTIYLDEGETGVTHEHVKGTSYTLTATVKNKDGSDAQTLYAVAGTAAPPVPSSAAPAHTSAANGTPSKGGSPSRAAGSSGDGTQSAPVLVSGGASSRPVSAKSDAVPVPVAPSPAIVLTSSGADASAAPVQNPSEIPLIALSAVLIGVSFVFAKKFSQSGDSQKNTEPGGDKKEDGTDQK